VARKVSWGTPHRTERYVALRPAFAYVRPSLIAALGLLLVLTVVYLFGTRATLAPGAVISAHARFETSCESCHAPGKGAANARCQRCHDPSGAGRLDNRAHVLFGSGDLKKSAAAPTLLCARCHIEHRGRTAGLATVTQTQCVSCHFRSFGAHPEFAVLRRPTREVPGLKFGHGPTARFKGHVAEVMEKWKMSESQACLACHEPEARDFQPLSFSRHCASCHDKDMQPTVGIPEADVLDPSALAALGLPANESEFARARGKIGKAVVRHKDDWIVTSLHRLRRSLAPEAFAAERGTMAAQLARLRRRLALAAPLANLSVEELKKRGEAIEREIQGLESRMAALAQAAGQPSAHVGEVAQAALATSTDAALKAEAEALQRALEGAAAKGAAVDFPERRRDLLELLDAVAAAQPAFARRVEDLRRRALALSPGEAAHDVLARSLEQRRLERDRVEDERQLRAGGAPPPVAVMLLATQRSLQRAIEDTEAQLRHFDDAAPVPAALTEDERAQKLDSADSLTSSCVKCHVVAQAKLAPVRAARPVLVRARFMHEPHLLQADCVRCHGGIEKSSKSEELNFRGIQSCRECHVAQTVRQDCLSCHRYHAPNLP
jgi:hypothetical protein